MTVIKTHGRIVRLRGNENVVLGVVLGGLKNGVVYEVQEIMGEIVLKPIGESLLHVPGQDRKITGSMVSEGSTLNDIVEDGTYLTVESDYEDGELKYMKHRGQIDISSRQE